MEKRECRGHYSLDTWSQTHTQAGEQERGCTEFGQDCGVRVTEECGAHLRLVWQQ